MPEPEWVDVEIIGRNIQFLLWPAGTDFEVDASDVEELNIKICIDALKAYSSRIEAVIARDEAIRIDLFVRLDAKKFAWEKSFFGIAINQTRDGAYVAQFPVITAIGSHKQELREALLPVIEGTGFTLFDLEEVEYETPLIEEDGRHNWTCEVSVIPEDETFKDLFLLRDNLSQAAFLHLNAIETPYLALRMIQLGQAPALLGHEESEWLECKSFAYEFKKIHESLWKHELAEDVAQFANTESGGLLLIGFHTKRKAGIDTIEKITPVPASDTRLQAYRDILRQRIHPPVGRLLIESFPWNGGQIVCIFVPPQKYENQPYLVSGSVIQGRYMRSGVTIVRRQGDASIPITAEEIHSTLVAGRAFLRGRMGKQAERDGP
jgi:Putative DNA-binding domain